MISLSILFFSFCNMIKEKEINITFINQSNEEEGKGRFELEIFISLGVVPAD
jgi:uncharacterized protein with ACT and thioredoxin-like domain